MALLVNLRHLERNDVRLEGELPVEELGLEVADEVVHPKEPLKYDLEAQKLDKNILVQGRLELTLDCECVRCLKPFKYRLKMPHWALHVPLEGEEAAEVA